MAFIKKTEKGSYLAQVQKGEFRKQKTFAKRSDAMSWSRDLEQSIEKKELKQIHEGTFGDLLNRYASEVSIHKAGSRWELFRIRAIKQQPIGNIPLSKLTAADVTDWRNAELKRVTPSTVRREWTLLSHACSIAVKEWQWISSNPFSNVRRPKEAKPRFRRVTNTEIAQLIAASGYSPNEKPDTLKKRSIATFLFACETAMRSQEITTLRWEHVYVEKRYAHLTTSKTGKGRDVPLTLEAVRIIEQMRGMDAIFVFGIHASQRDTNFRHIRDKAGIKNLHFHDSRHEAITRLASKVHVLDLARIVGHQDLKQLMVYYNKSAEDIASLL